MLTTLLIIAAIFVCIVALVGTLLVGKEISSKQALYEKEGRSLQDELARSHEYEKTSISVNIKSLSWIYVGLTILVIIISLGIFFY